MSGSRGRGGKGPGRGPGGRPDRGAAASGNRPATAGKDGNEGNEGKGGASARQSPVPAVVGKRPSRPGFLAACALLWFAAALFAFFGLHSGWKLIPAICFAGVGFLYLRGAAGSYLRRPGPAPTTKK